MLSLDETEIYITELLNSCNSVFIPPPKITVSKWAERYRIKSSESSSMGGRWRNLPYQVEIMDAFNNPTVEEIVIMSSAQVGKTEILLNILGYIVDTNPAGILIVFPTIEDCKVFSRTRLLPMFRDCKRLSEKLVSDYDSGRGRNINNALFKDIPGGFIRLVGSNSASALASMPLPYVLADEVDKYGNITKEGDALSLALTRNKMQFNRKAIITSTPTIEGESRIEHFYNTSDKRCFYVPCIHCKKEQVLNFENVKWEKLFKKNKTIHLTETAHYVCEHCKQPISDTEKNKMVKQGRWVASEKFYGRAGFHLNELYSPFRTMKQIADDFIKKKGNPETLQEFVNSVLGQVWLVDKEQIDRNELIDRRENYYEPEAGLLLPAKGGLLTAGVDIQGDRIEVTVWLWGVGDEGWAIEHRVLYGDIYQSKVWEDLDLLLDKQYKHPGGSYIGISCAAVDTGFATDKVYQYINRRRYPCVAIKGRGGLGEPLVRSTVSHPDRLKVPLYIIGVDTAKNTIYQRSRIKAEGLGCLHWNFSFDNEYFKQFTAEYRVKVIKNGIETFVWRLPSGARNEALDCAIYAYSARWIVGVPDLSGLIKRLNSKDNREKVTDNKPKRSKFNSDWVKMNKLWRN